LVDGCFDAGAQLGRRSHAADGFDGRRRLAGVAGNGGDEKVGRFRTTREGDGAEQNGGECGVSARVEAADERGHCFGATHVGEREGGLGGGVVFLFKSLGDEGNGGWAIKREQSGIDSAQDFGFVLTQKRAQAQQQWVHVPRRAPAVSDSPPQTGSN